MDIDVERDIKVASIAKVRETEAEGESEEFEEGQELSETENGDEL